MFELDEHRPPQGLVPLKIDISSPFYLGPNDHPDNIISEVMFRGHNYDKWSKYMRLSLKARRKFGFVSGEIQKPTDTNLLVEWECVQAMVVHWILNTIDMSIRERIPCFEEARPLWDMLARRFNVKDGQREQELKVALAHCKQSRFMSVADYLGKLQTLWDELDTYNPLLACSCGKCECNLGELFQRRMDEEKLHKFLFGINEKLFGKTRSFLLTQDPLPTLDRAYNTMINQERVHSHCGYVNCYESRFKPPRCSYCHRSGHEISTCYYKHGFPERWNNESRFGGWGGPSTSYYF